ncbi:ribonuclease H2, subunit C [Mycena amicta]|nr:ribonuclease H2, subunit C [Mycena amicta]
MSPALTIGSFDSLADATPSLMPFHIQHDGLAPISTYFLVEAAPENVAKPPSPTQEDEMQVDSVEEEDKGQSLPRRVTDATTRFVATFRGRTMHGLKMALPSGYSGVVMTGGSQKTKATTKKNKPKSKSRTTRRAAMRIDEEEDVDGEGAVRTLMPTARFSSFVLWHPDIPVDPGRDEYARSLTEWIQLANEIHRVDE